jgi:hypothetical protein
MAANQLKDRLVDFCVTKWRSKGSSMNTIQEVISKTSHFSFDPKQHGQAVVQEGEIVFLKNSQHYIWIPYDDTSPSSDPKIQQQGQELDQYILNNPSVVYSLDALLDKDIEAFGLNSLWNDLKPLTEMNRHEKVCYLLK